MRIVLDTNVLLVSISSRSRFHKIFHSFINGKYEVCVTDEILFEYEEILKNHLGENVANIVLEIFENATNVLWINKYFKWNLISADPDDNKFTDCAVAANAELIVTNDRHFHVLQKIPFPKIKTSTAEIFLKTIETL